MNFKYNLAISSGLALIFLSQSVLADCISAKAYLEENKAAIANLPQNVETIKSTEKRDAIKEHKKSIDDAVEILNQTTQKQNYSDAENELCQRSQKIIEGFLNEYLSAWTDDKLEKVKEAKKVDQLQLDLTQQILEAANSGNIEEIKRLVDQLMLLKSKGAAEIIGK